MILDQDENLIDNFKDGKIFDANFSFTFFEGLNKTSNVDISFIPCYKSKYQHELVEKVINHINQSAGLTEKVFKQGMCLNHTQWEENYDKLFV